MSRLHALFHENTAGLSLYCIINYPRLSASSQWPWTMSFHVQITRVFSNFLLCDAMASFAPPAALDACANWSLLEWRRKDEAMEGEKE